MLGGRRLQAMGQQLGAQGRRICAPTPFLPPSCPRSGHIGSGLVVPEGSPGIPPRLSGLCPLLRRGLGQLSNQDTALSKSQGCGRLLAAHCPGLHGAGCGVLTTQAWPGLLGTLAFSLEAQLGQGPQASLRSGSLAQVSRFPPFQPPPCVPLTGCQLLPAVTTSGFPPIRCPL